MKNLILGYLAIAFFIFGFQPVAPATNSFSKDITSNDIFRDAAFVENKGIYEPYQGQKVEYILSHRDMVAFFTKQGVIYKLSVTKKENEAEEEKERVKGKNVGPEGVLKARYYYIQMQWEGANPDPQIITEGKQEGDQVYLKNDGDGYKTIRSQGYQKITYKDLYPGIDVEYIVSDKGGIEYSLIVHPGADAGQVKMTYSGDTKALSRNNTGDIIIKSEGGSLIEHAPTSYYTSKASISSPFQLKSKSIQFKMPDSYDRTQTLIIDPWVTTMTTLTSNETGFIVDYDYLGNLYVYGGGGGTGANPQTFKVVKYPYGGGGPAYTFNGTVPAQNWYSYGVEYDPGSFAVDKPTGKAYIGQGVEDFIGAPYTYYYKGFYLYKSGTAYGSNQIVRIDSSGNYDNFISGINTDFMEAWGFTYNCANSTILIAGGSFTNYINFGILNPVTATVTSINITGILTNSISVNGDDTARRQDIASLAQNTQGNTFAIFSEPTTGDPQSPDVGNKIYALNSTLNGNLWSTPTGYTTLNEFQNHPGFTNPEARKEGFNYTGNGYNCLAANNTYVFYYDGLNLKAFNATTGAAVGTATKISGGSVLTTGGIAVDNCNDLYLGGKGVIYTYTFNGSTFTAGTPISLGTGYTTADVYDVRYNSSNNMVYATGIGFAGIYNATISTTCIPNLLSVSTVRECTSIIANLTPSNTVSNPTFTYIWTDTTGKVVSQTNSTTLPSDTLSGVPAGKYYVKAFMDLNCASAFQLDSAILGVPMRVNSNDTSICNGKSVTLDAVAFDTSGGTFTWTPGGSTSPSITVSPDTTTTYKVTYSICNATDSSKIIVSPAPTLSPTNAFVCSGNNITVKANPSVPGGTYSWSPGGYTTDSFTISPTSNSIYTVIYSVPGCSSVSDSAVINITPPPTLTGPASVSVCSGGSAKIYITPSVTGGTYVWSPGGATTDTVLVSPPVTTTYTVTYTLGCSAKDSVVAKITQAPLAVAISTPSATACPGASVPLTAVVTPVTCGAAIGSGSCGSGNSPAPASYGTGTVTSALSPFGGIYTGFRYQALYRADSLRAAGIKAGTMVQLQLNIAHVNSVNPYTGFTIQLGCTGDQQVSIYGWEPANTVVYSTNSYTPTQGINTFIFSQPYDWDGVSNLALQICFGDTTTPGAIDDIVSSSVLYPASMAAVSDTTTNGCSLLTNLIDNNINYSVPNVTFYFCGATTPNFNYAWSPTSNLTSISTDTTTALNLTQPATYYVTVSDSLCTTTDSIHLTIDTASLSLEPRDTTLCGPDTVLLSVDLNGTLPVQCGPNGNTCAGPAAYLQVGTSNTDNSVFAYPAPFGNFNPSAMQQYLYTAADLKAAGVVAGRISQIAFWVDSISSGSTTEYDNYFLAAGCSSVNALSIGAPVTGLTTVYTPRTVNLTNTAGWVNFVLDTDIDWDGVSNLVIENCFDNTNTTNPLGSNTGNAHSRYVTTGNVITSTVNASNTTEACYSPYGDGTIPPSGASSRPIVRLNMCQAPLPYTISWSPGATLSDSTSKTPYATPTKTTTYYVTVHSPSGCTKKDSLTINVGKLAPSSNKDTAACVGSQIQLTAEGGNVYSWTPGTGLSCTNCPNPVVTVATNIQYVVTITDTTKGCSANDTVNIVALNPPTIPYTNDTIFCFTDSVTIDAGSGDSLYVWSPTNPISNDSVYEVKTPGTYSVTVTGFNGCTVSDTINIHQFSLPLVNLGDDTSVCAPATITLNAGGPYVTYSWNTGASTQTIVADSTADYSVTVTDANGCKSSDSILIGVNPTPVINLGGPDTACFTDSVRLSANNGPTYTYTWSTGSTDSVIEVTNLNAGEIYVTVSGGGLACSSVDSVNVFFRPAVAVFIGDDTTVCVTDSVTFSAGPGFADYVWSNGDSGAAVSSITVHVAGTYYVTVTDAHGCKGSDSATLTLQSDSVYLGPDTSVCLGTTLVLGNRLGNPFTSYHWNTGATTDTIHVTSTGPYSLTATPASGCPGVDTINVTFVTHPVVTLPSSEGLCPGSKDTLSPGPQTPGTTYLWSDNSTDSILVVSVVDTYWVQVTNLTGCVTRDTIVVFPNPAPVVPFLHNASICKGDSTTIDVGPGFSSYLWSTSATTDSIRVSAAEKYFVTVTDSKGCSAVDSETVANIVVSINLGNNFNLCPGDSTVLNAGSNYVDYTWSATVTIPVDNTDTLLVKGAGTYSVAVVDSNGCTGGDSITIGINPPVIPAFHPDSVYICENSGGTTLYPGPFRTYVWSNGTNNSTLTTDSTGEYYVVVTDSFNCSARDSAYVKVFPTVTPLITGGPTICGTATDTLTSFNTYVAYLWSNGDSTQTITINNSGTYTLIVKDTNGCADTGSYTVKSGSLLVTPSVDSSLPIEPSTVVMLSATVTPFDSTVTYTYTWSPSTGIDSVSNAKIQNPTTAPTVTTLYSVTVTDPQTGCTGSETITITVDTINAFAFPSAFTPNHDGHNDFFGLITAGNVTLEEFKIYDRWGNVVHDTPVPWDGQVGGKDQPVGTYVYTAVIQYIDLATNTSHTINFKGQVTLLR